MQNSPDTLDDFGAIAFQEVQEVNLLIQICCKLFFSRMIYSRVFHIQKLSGDSNDSCFKDNTFFGNFEFVRTFLRG